MENVAEANARATLLHSPYRIAALLVPGSPDIDPASQFVTSFLFKIEHGGTVEAKRRTAIELP